jgi:hypothetical protein
VGARMKVEEEGFIINSVIFLFRSFINSTSFMKYMCRETLLKVENSYKIFLN